MRGICSVAMRDMMIHDAIEVVRGDDSISSSIISNHTIYHVLQQWRSARDELILHRVSSTIQGQASRLGNVNLMFA